MNIEIQELLNTVQVTSLFNMTSIRLQSRSQQGDFIPLKTLEKEDQRISVRLPDLFILFLSESPAVNSHYLKIKDPSEAWISK